MYAAPQPQDSEFMQLALQQAELARYRTSPNPYVGCVLVKDGHIIGRGATQAAGHDHAEITALKDALAHGHSPVGATAYVTLEPCNHTGRTGPCSHALVKASIARVVAAIKDPSPLTAGNGLQTLLAAGLQVTLGVEATAAMRLHQGFIKRMVTGTPWIRLKVATSLDGYVALPNGQSQWLTGPAARVDTHHWRACSCAVLTGVGTVLADNPQLDVRHVQTPRQPLRFVLDTHLRTPVDAAMLNAGSAVTIVHAGTQPERAKALAAKGAKLVVAPRNAQGQLDLTAVARVLGDMQLNEVHLECGSTLGNHWLAAGLVDEVLLYQAPVLLGSGMPWFAHTPAFTSLAQAPRLILQDAVLIGGDVRLRLYTAQAFEPVGLTGT